eukprot:6503003-Prymnesium_polylepis.1
MVRSSRIPPYTSRRAPSMCRCPIFPQLYTGNIAPAEAHQGAPGRWCWNASGPYSVAANSPFVLGGAGTVLSLGALERLSNIDTCIASSLPGGNMWAMQSDWMIGECVARAGFAPLHLAQRGAFNQFACEKPMEKPAAAS